MYEHWLSEQLQSFLHLPAKPNQRQEAFYRKFQQNNANDRHNQFQEIGVRSKIYRLKYIEISMTYGLLSEYKDCFGAS